MRTDRLTLVQIFDEGNNDKIKFLVICQNFPYQIFSLPIANVPLTTVLSIF